MGNETSGQASWGGGIYRGRNAPEDSLYDLVNGLINDEGNAFRRGGSEYFSAAVAPDVLVGLADLFLTPGRRLMVWGENSLLYVLDEAAPGFVAASMVGVKPLAIARAVQLGPLAVFQRRSVPDEVIIYGGSLKASAYSTGTVSVTAGSPTVTGSGTSWLANVDAGMLFSQVGTGAIGIVATVDSNTQLTLRSPWGGPTSAGGSYGVESTIAQTAPPSAEKLGAEAVAVAAVGSPARLVLCFNNRAYFTEPGGVALDDNAFHELPSSEVIIGADSFEDTLILFTTGGVWTVANMSFDPVDDAGNVQHIVSEVSKDLILWGDPGIAARGTSLIIPAIDDIYMFSLSGGAAVLSEGIRPLYRSYVKAGYQPGVAAVHRGHYFLPILNGVERVDTLVCRLDRDGAPVTRWDGHAAAVAFARRAGATTRAPQLLAVAEDRVLDLSGCFDPQASNATDADGVAHDLTWITRDFPTSGSNHPGTVARVRVRQELVDDGDGGTAAPALALAYSSDQDAGAFTTLTPGVVEASATAAGGVSDGSRYHAWPVGKQRERIRFRGTVTGAAASCVLRTIELLIRQSGLR